MQQVKRPKVKLRVRPWAPWLPEVMESLDLDLNTFLDYIPKITKHQSLDDVFRIRCNFLSHSLIKAFHKLQRKRLFSLYPVVCNSTNKEHNITFIFGRMIYVICDSVGMMTPRMQRNYEELLTQGPSKVIDIFGGSWKTEYRQRTGAKTNKSSQKKKPLKDRGPTVTGTIEALLIRDNGASKDEIVHELVRRFPTRAEHAMRNTVGVQLSSHLKKKHGSKLRVLTPGRYQIVQEQ